ncbi:MAG: PEP-CTERM sorting domain-containing protein [Phycisphaerae bacterium]|nr:PEP-CTERM sorting domain-containing protein [Phycisphaerae bacterium]
MAHWGISRRSKVWVGLVLSISLMWGASAAQGSLISLDLSISYNGGTPPEGAAPWLNATFTDSVEDEVTLTLSATNLTGSENVKEWMFNLDTDLDPTDLSISFSLVDSTGSFNTPSISTGLNAFKADGDGYFDILIDFNPTNGPNKRFGAGEAAVFTISYIPGGDLLTADSFDLISEPDGGQGEYKTAAHVQSIGPGGQDSGWVATPEPATIVLMGLGGLLGLLRKRKA